ncbi:hypothetical protein HDU84_008234 [Entophlyctis sp. JEL0112]|nr:hypothetical protein HDU84_008234 [Entophlyctis sp. JEL0112]
MSRTPSVGPGGPVAMTRSLSARARALSAPSPPMLPPPLPVPLAVPLPVQLPLPLQLPARHHPVAHKSALAMSRSRSNPAAAAAFRASDPVRGQKPAPRPAKLLWPSPLMRPAPAASAPAAVPAVPAVPPVVVPMIARSKSVAASVPAAAKTPAVVAVRPVPAAPVPTRPPSVSTAAAFTASAASSSSRPNVTVVASSFPKPASLPNPGPIIVNAAGGGGSASSTAAPLASYVMPALTMFLLVASSLIDSSDYIVVDGTVVPLYVSYDDDDDEDEEVEDNKNRKISKRFESNELNEFFAAVRNLSPENSVSSKSCKSHEKDLKLFIKSVKILSNEYSSASVVATAVSEQGGEVWELLQLIGSQVGEFCGGLLNTRNAFVEMDKSKISEFLDPLKLDPNNTNLLLSILYEEGFIPSPQLVQKVSALLSIVLESIRSLLAQAAELVKPSDALIQELTFLRKYVNNQPPGTRRGSGPNGGAGISSSSNTITRINIKTHVLILRAIARVAAKVAVLAVTQMRPAKVVERRHRTSAAALETIQAAAAAMHGGQPDAGAPTHVVESGSLKKEKFISRRSAPPALAASASSTHTGECAVDHSLATGATTISNSSSRVAISFIGHPSTSSISAAGYAKAQDRVRGVHEVPLYDGISPQVLAGINDTMVSGAVSDEQIGFVADTVVVIPDSGVCVQAEMKEVASEFGDDVAEELSVDDAAVPPESVLAQSGANPFEGDIEWEEFRRRDMGIPEHILRLEFEAILMARNHKF